MNNILDTYDRLQAKVSNLKEQSARVDGKIETLKEELNSRGFDSIEKAVVWLGKAKTEQVNLEKEIQDGLNKAEKLIVGIEK